MIFTTSLLFEILYLTSRALAELNFPFEETQLSKEDIQGFPALCFGDTSDPFVSSSPSPRCKVLPEDLAWPSDDEWAKFNASIHGKLLKRPPPAAACYPGPYSDPDLCTFLIQKAAKTSFYLDDPVTVLNTWPEGDTCFLGINLNSTCTQGGYPTYVVNASTVRDVQAAVNFARNNNIRLNIK
jgi:hypothetical protein